MNYTITTYGGGEAFYYVFQGVAALMDSQGFINNIFRLGGTVGILWVFVMITFKNAWEQALLWLFWFMVATLVLFTPKSTVWIKDPLSFSAPSKVDNVPFALAAFAGITSQIGTALTEKMESLFTLPDYMPYHQTGTVFASKLMLKARQIKITDPEFRGNIERFVNRCVVYDAMIGLKYTLKDLQRSTDVWTLVSSNASPVLGFMYRAPGAGTQGQIVTCKKGAETLQTLWQDQIKEAERVFGSGFFQKNSQTAQSTFMTALPQSFQLLTKLSAEAPKLLQQEMMINAIRDGSNNKLDELRGSVGYAASKALMNQEMNNRTMGEIASEMLVIARAVIEALCYASFIFVVILSLVHNGYRILWNYMGVLMWLQMWAPLYAVLNLFMTLYGQYRCSSIMIGGGLTMMNSAGLTQINAQVASMAGWLSCSLPFLAYGIVKGGVGSFMHIASNIVSSSQGAVSSASSEAASGNFSLGNVTIGTQAYQNMTAFQHNSAPSFRDGSFEQVFDDGTGLITQADGSQVFKSGQGFTASSSRLKFDINSSLGQRAEEAINHQASVLQSQSEEYSQSRMSAARQVVNLAQSWGKGQSGSDGFSHDNSVGENRSLSQAMKFTKSLEDRFGFSESQSADVTASLMAGTPKWLGISADIKGSGSSKADHSNQASDIQQMAKDMGVSNSLDDATKSISDQKFSNSQSQEARMAQDIGHTMEKSDSLRSSMAKTQQTLDSYNKVQALSQSKGINMNRDGYQDLLEFTAKETKNGHAMGMRNAQFLLDQGGMEAEQIQARFADAKFNQLKSSIEGGMTIGSEADVTALYNNTSLPNSGSHGAMKEQVDRTFEGVTSSSIQAQADNQGLIRPIDRSSEDRYYQQSAQVKGQINQAESTLSDQGQNMQTSTDHNMDRSIVGAAAYNALEAPPGIGHIARAVWGSNFEKPTQDNIAPSKIGPSQQVDQSWKWNTPASSGSNAFPGNQGNTVIIQKENTTVPTQGVMPTPNVNVSNNVNHQINNSSTTGVGSRIVTETSDYPREARPDSSTSNPSNSPSSTIKQSNFGKGRK
ncbi:MAG: conjugal transfer protein TraG N-terminal domain-containing protein [Janthinobacterium lividum]